MVRRLRYPYSFCVFDYRVGAESERQCAGSQSYDGKGNNGAEADQTAALAKFNDAKDPVRDRDLYVFCFDMGTGKITTHINPAVIGTDGRTAKEKDGTPFGRRLYDAAVEGKINTVNYNFPKPGSTDPVPKEAYVTRGGNQGCAVGYYK